MWRPLSFVNLLGLLLLSVAAQAAPVVPDASESSNPIVTTIQVAEGAPKVEIHIIEIVKTVTETEAICAHTTGLKTGVAIGLETPVPTITSVPTESTSTTHQQTPAATSLIPAVHWDVDVYRVENLQANKSVDMFYCEHKLERTGGKASRPSNNTAVGSLKIENMQYPSVQLDHTAYISSVGCYNDSVQVVFNNRKAFSIAQADWSSHKSGVILISTAPQCRLTTEPMERGYILVKSVTANNSTMTIVGKHEPVSFADAAGHETPIDFSFGNFQTNSTDGFNIPATGPMGIGNGTTVHPPFSPPNATLPASDTTLRDPSGDSSFDEDLDRQIGVMTTEEFETQMLGRYNVSLQDITEDDDIPDLLPGHKIRRRQLVRRGLFKSIKKGLKKIGNAVKDTVNTVGHVVTEVTGKVGDVIEKGIDKLGQWLSITKSFNKDFSFDTKENQQTTQTPWGAGVELFSKATPGGSGSAAVYCVDCGAEGKVVLEGKITFSVIKGLETGYISADGNLHASLQIGIVASFKDHWVFEKDIVNVPLSPYTIPGIITLGPSLSLSAGAELDILAEGQLLAGITADMPNFSARFDLKDHDKSVAPNFGSQAQPVFDGKGKIVVSADAFLALKLAVGINILSGVFKKSVGIVEKPKLFLTAGVDASFSLDEGAQFANPNCKGLSIELGFANELYLDLFGSKKIISDAKGPSWDHCFVLQKDHNTIQEAPFSNNTIQEEVHGNSTVKTSTQVNTTTWEPPSNQSTPRLSPAAPAQNSFFSKLMAWNGTLGLHYSPNANIYAVLPGKVEDPTDVSSIFTSDPSGDFIIGDSHGRYLHGYKTEIDSFGVGRLRLHTADAMPKTASLLSFASTHINGTGESLAILADLAGAIYFPIVCMYDTGIFPKLFLAKDPVAGVATLEDEKLEGVITGSKVKACGYLPMRQETLR